MVNVAPYFETADLQGSTDPYSGTVGTSYVAVPAVAGNVIQSALISCDYDQDVNNELIVSFDGGVSDFVKLSPGGFINPMLRGSIRQIYIKGNVSSVSYSIILNKEAF